MISANKNIEISVLMAVYNGEEFVKKAIISILKQTYKNFELIIVNDGSTDSTNKIILSFADSRIKLINNKKNIGLARSLNKGARAASGKYIARIDADDFSSKERLEIQYKFLEKNKDIGIVGSWANIYKTPHSLKYATTHEEIKAEMLFNNPIVHSSVFIRSELLKVHLYDPRFVVAQDYELWARLLDKTKFANVPIIMIYRLEHGENLTNKKTILKNDVTEVQRRLLSKIGINATLEELDLHAKLFMGNRILTDTDIPKVNMWISSIMRANNKTHYFASIYLYKKIIVYLLVKTCTSNLSFMSKFKLVATLAVFSLRYIFLCLSF